MRRTALPVDAVKRARKLRIGATPAERLLWRALGEALPEARFRRQVPLGLYVVDFCSHAARIVIEVDGSQHAEARGYDAARTRFLQGEGYRVLRFWNNEVLENLDGVLRAIEAALPTLPPRKRVREDTEPYTPTPLPPCGGERRKAAAEGGAPLSGARSEAAPDSSVVKALRAQSLRDCTPYPLPSPTRGEGGSVNLRLESARCPF